MIGEFIETSIFEKTWKSCGLSDGDLRMLQNRLLQNPQLGTSIGSGLRKARVSSGGHGKSGGSRVIYFSLTEDDCIYLLLCFPKNKQENLTSEQMRILKDLVDRIKGGKGNER